MTGGNIDLLKLMKLGLGLSGKEGRRIVKIARKGMNIVSKTTSGFKNLTRKLPED